MHQAMKTYLLFNKHKTVKTYGGVEVQLHVLTSALDWGE
jgi:hypothetical protein